MPAQTGRPQGVPLLPEVLVNAYQDFFALWKDGAGYPHPQTSPKGIHWAAVSHERRLAIAGLSGTQLSG